MLFLILGMGLFVTVGTQIYFEKMLKAARQQPQDCVRNVCVQTCLLSPRLFGCPIERAGCDITSGEITCVCEIKSQCISGALTTCDRTTRDTF